MDAFNGAGSFKLRRNAQGERLLWSNPLRTRECPEDWWVDLPDKERVVGSFVEVGMFRDHPGIEVVVAIDAATGEVRTRGVAYARFAQRWADPDFDTIVEVDPERDLAVVETRHLTMNAPVHDLVVPDTD